jgi:hypothetical protein
LIKIFRKMMNDEEIFSAEADAPSKTPEVELKSLPSSLRYEFLGPDETYLPRTSNPNAPAGSAPLGTSHPHPLSPCAATSVPSQPRTSNPAAPVSHLMPLGPVAIATSTMLPALPPAPPAEPSVLASP